MPFTFFSGDTYEPNDSIADAFGPIIFGRQYISYIADDRDTDFYRIYADADRNIIVYLEDIPEDTNYDLQFFDSLQRVLDVSSESRQKPEILSFETDAAGTYYVEVVSRYGYSANKPYSLMVDSAPLAPGMISVSKVYPNPGPGSEGRIWFEYKLLVPVRSITLDIYTTSGTLIYTHNTTDVSGTGQIVWEPITDAGQKVASGIYIYALKTNLNGQADTKTGKVAVIY